MSIAEPHLLQASRIAAVALLWGVATIAAGQSGPEGGSPPTAVEAVVLTTQPLNHTIRAVGTLRADESVVIRPELAGRIEKIHFQEGQHVAKGELLISLDASLIVAELREAEANVAASERTFSRAKDLIDRKLIAQADYDNTRAQLAVDEARLSSARTRLDKTVIKAPFAGVLGLRQFSVGDYVEVGQELVSIVKLDPIKVDFRVPQVHISKLAPGQPIELTLDSFPGELFRGHVLAIDPQIDPTGRNVVLRAVAPNPERKLRPGLFARVALQLEQREAALLAPEEALWPQGDRQYVFRIDDGKAKLVEVEVGLRASGHVEILRGLTAGDRIVTTGQLKLFDGAPVAPIYPAAAANPVGDAAASADR